MKALINARIFDFVNYVEQGYLLFDQDIAEAGAMEGFPGAEEVIDCKGALVMPGLANCHTHVYSAFARGMNIPFHPKSFKDILEQLWWRLDRQLDREAVYYSGLAYGADCIRAGVTSIIDHHASGRCIKGALGTLKSAISDRLGMRGIYCFETSDRFPVMDCIEENLEFAEQKNEKTGSMFGLHASMSLSDESLSAISKALKGRPIHIHVAESFDDVADCYSQYHENVVERLDRFGLLNKNSILAHCCHISKEEAALIGERGCYIAMNPTSNMNNSVGLPDYGLFKKNGVQVLLGNDGLGANITRDYLNLFFGMKNRLGSPLKFSMEDLAEVICRGYEYMGVSLGIHLGRLETGYKADFIVMPYLPPTPMSKDNALGHIIFGVFDCFRPQQVWIGGQRVLNNYELEEDLEKELEEAAATAAKVWNRL